MNPALSNDPGTNEDRMLWQPPRTTTSPKAIIALFMFTMVCT